MFFSAHFMLTIYTAGGRLHSVIGITTLVVPFNDKTIVGTTGAYKRKQSRLIQVTTTVKTNVTGSVVRTSSHLYQIARITAAEATQRIRNFGC